MADIEKVTKGLECHKNGLCQIDDKTSCPYWECEKDCSKHLMGDALKLLKAQQPKKGSWDYGTQCSVCKGTIIPPKDRRVRVNFCPWCGADMRGEH